jgi:hypothetical protein
MSIEDALNSDNPKIDEGLDVEDYCVEKTGYDWYTLLE